ncbi:MAG: IMP dehydrogenase, partial [Acidimicrobiaceae bacterium]
MRFLNDSPAFDLTYSDVFMVPSLSGVKSRLSVDLTTPDGIGTTIPLVVSNMTAIAGRRMAETVARRGGVVVLPQDIPLDVVETVVKFVKSRHKIIDTPITMKVDGTVGEALSLIYKRSHGAVIVVDDDERPAGIFTEHDAVGFDRFTQIRNVMSSEMFTLNAKMSPQEMFEHLTEARLSVAPVIDNKERLVGVITRNGALRSTIYSPAVDSQNRLLIAAAVGVNADPAERAKKLQKMGVDVIVVDTAHGHQVRMLEAISEVKKVVGDTKVVAGNVVTSEGTRDIINAGADIVKVGVGPGAMCTTRMMTGVGRPQFSAVLDCARVAADLGKQVW